MLRSLESVSFILDQLLKTLCLKFADPVTLRSPCSLKVAVTHPAIMILPNILRNILRTLTDSVIPIRGEGPFHKMLYSNHDEEATLLCVADIYRA